jgi:predicted MFS family arabinose efflux permease
VGKKIDEYSLFKYSFFVISILFLSSIFFSFINNLFFLVLGIFLMRFSGQGLMSHTATTAISRYFEKSRGKALSISWLGLSSAEFLLPVMVIYFLTIFSWKNIWQGISVLIILILPLLISYTIKKINFDSREENTINKSKVKIKNWTRKEVLRDYRFYIILLNMLAMPWIFTGIAVYQSFISDSKFWDSYTIPKAFMAYSLASIITLFSSGFLVDKFTSRKLIPLMNLPLLFSMAVLFFLDSSLSAYLFLGLIGISNGFTNILGTSTWAEIYGVKHIGSIKALTTAFMVFSTAFGTAIFGLFIDRGVSVENIAMISGIYIVVSLILLVISRKSIEPIIL